MRIKNLTAKILLILSSFIFGLTNSYSNDLSLYNEALNYCIKKYGFKTNECFILPRFIDIHLQKEVQDKYSIKVRKYSRGLANNFKNNKDFELFLHDSLSGYFSCKIMKDKEFKLEKDLFKQIEDQYKAGIIVSFPKIVYDYKHRYAVVVIYFYSGVYQENRPAGSVNSLIFKKIAGKWKIQPFNRFGWGS